jgi:hypothetical protein
VYLIACGIKIKMKCSFFTFNCKILNLSILRICRKNCNKSDLTDYKIITIEGEEKVFLVESPNCCQCFEIQKKLGG